MSNRFGDQTSQINIRLPEPIYIVNGGPPLQSSLRTGAASLGPVHRWVVAGIQRSQLAIEITRLQDPHPACQDAALFSDLSCRWLEAHCMLPGLAKASRAQAESHFTYSAQMRELVRDALIAMGADPSRNRIVDGVVCPAYDWASVGYATFEADAAHVRRQLAIQVPDIASLIPNWTAEAGNTGAGAADDLLAKLLAALGVMDIYSAFLAVIDDGWPSLIKGLIAAVKRRDWNTVNKCLKKLLDAVLSREFFRRLSARVGREAAARFIGSVAAKCLPFAGWAILIGQLAWAFAEELF